MLKDRKKKEIEKKRPWTGTRSRGMFGKKTWVGEWLTGGQG